MTVRTTNCLEERGIFTVSDLLRCTPEDLLGISNFGEKVGWKRSTRRVEGIGFFRESKREDGALMKAPPPSQPR